MAKIRGYPDISYNIRRWTAALLSYLAGSRGRPPVFYDIGAHVGEFTITFADSCSAMHAFEPVPETMEQLRKAADGLPGVNLHQLALSDAPGTLSLQRFSDPSFNSLYARSEHELVHYNISRAEPVSVPVVRLDDYIAEGRLPDPDFVKIDIEGAELPALRGAAAAIARNMPVILCEYSVDNTGNAGYPREEIARWLSERGYLVRGLFRDRDLSLHEDLSERSIWNIIAVPEQDPDALDPGLVAQPSDA